MNALRALALAVLACCIIQQPALAQVAPASVAVPAGPRALSAATAVRHTALPGDATAQPAARQNMGRPVALMVVGGAAILVGAIVGDAPGTIIMIGGAVALLVGLYQYLE